jgi:electron transport complex protein RnfG
MQKLKFLKPALSLLIITMGIALLLSVVNFITEDRIAENALAEKRAAISEIFPELDTFESKTFDSMPSTVTDVGIAVNDSGDALGYYVEAAPMGLNGNITMIIGLNNDGKVEKVICLSSSETPGFGTKATDGNYFKLFSSLNSDGASRVDTISGATISSKAVRLGISEACQTVEMLMEVQ